MWIPRVLRMYMSDGITSLLSRRFDVDSSLGFSFYSFSLYFFCFFFFSLIPYVHCNRRDVMLFSNLLLVFSLFGLNLECLVQFPKSRINSLVFYWVFYFICFEFLSAWCKWLMLLIVFDYLKSLKEQNNLKLLNFFMGNYKSF